MRNSRAFGSVALLLLLPAIGFAQDAGSGSNLLQLLLLGVVVLLIIVVVVMVANSFLNVEARATGAAKKGENFGIVPSSNELFAKDLPDGIDRSQVHYLRRGFNLNLLGEPAHEIEDKLATTYAVQPPNFIGMSPIPAVEPSVGDTVKAGEVIFYDKKRPRIKYVAPVSGEVIELNRGAKRAITSVVILADKVNQFHQHNPPSVAASREEIVEFMLEAGVWPMLRQRPYNVVPDPDDVPKSIFISTFDTAPLAPDLNYVVFGKEQQFQDGLEVLSRLTSGKVHLGINAKGPIAHAFRDAVGVEKHYFSGEHPAGNVGVHIHHVDPVAPDQIVWTAGVQDVITIGRLFAEGVYDATRIVALAGAEFERPHYIRTYMGAKLSDLIQGELTPTEGDVRLISGDVLSGVTKSPDEFLNFYDDQITTIEEGNYFEMFGWLLPIDPRPSRSGTFPNKLYGKNYRYKANTNTHGEKRAFVVTGEYEAVLPMDILPQHLMKAIMVNDFERMEGLGIYELVEEDIALCEFACTSKQPLQRILRQGLEVMREQG